MQRLPAEALLLPRQAPAIPFRAGGTFFRTYRYCLKAIWLAATFFQRTEPKTESPEPLKNSFLSTI